MKAKFSPRNTSGFTLIELVISAALMAGILAGAYLCLQAGFSGQKLVESRSSVAQNARVALAIMSADLRSACPLSEDFDFLGMNRTINEIEADNLDFATHNYTPARPREGDFCEVSYFLDKGPDSESFSLWRRRDPTPDLEPLAGGNREEIAQGVRGLKFEYFDGFDWYDEWGDAEGAQRDPNSSFVAYNMYGMPEAVRITLAFDSEKPSPNRETGAEDTRAPPRVFQTVVHLNLAASSQLPDSGGGTESGSDAGGENTRRN